MYVCESVNVPDIVWVTDLVEDVVALYVVVYHRVDVCVNEFVSDGATVDVDVKVFMIVSVQVDVIVVVELGVCVFEEEMEYVGVPVPEIDAIFVADCVDDNVLVTVSDVD